ncbi:4-hydroxyphenylpyruvate dioxygenase [Saccharothrix syringae]|uniref:4-hydroxyphenylpyruvate dioxygenase n=1 Tax=Saccharothrix syringae TaxID=103733 RepID=A0A5Q0H4X6_SACSY|nr:4-hydroxyphenylpyruvate dioxygenase [Saccharothrix syringae]QFZ20984.1 4-hydroxyphenylpyruvate dioxygenase [Saccharothrix syringae]
MSDGPTFSHVEFCVGDATARAGDMVRRYGFEVVAKAGAPGRGDAHSIAVRSGRTTVVMTEGHTDDHPASLYVSLHGDGVSDIAIRVPDVRRALATAVDAGARVLAEPRTLDEPAGAVTARIAAFGDVAHTLVQSPEGAEPPGLRPVPRRTGHRGARLDRLDHFAVCLPAGMLDDTVRFYQDVLGFEPVFEERIVIGSQAMNSRVVQSRSRELTMVLIEPDTTTEAGQVDDFVKDHGGPGVQHIALTSDDIVGTVAALRERGVEFLSTPDTYYELLATRLDPTGYTVAELREQNVLVDQDHDGQLFQIFTRSVHARRTFFFEVIERMGAKTFGSGNIKALYEAVELERVRRRDGGR